jgi:hypothetical protein
MARSFAWKINFHRHAQDSAAAETSLEYFSGSFRFHADLRNRAKPEVRAPTQADLSTATLAFTSRHFSIPSAELRAEVG